MCVRVCVCVCVWACVLTNSSFLYFKDFSNRCLELGNLLFWFEWRMRLSSLFLCLRFILNWSGIESLPCFSQYMIFHLRLMKNMGGIIMKRVLYLLLQRMEIKYYTVNYFQLGHSLRIIASLWFTRAHSSMKKAFLYVHWRHW